MTSASTRAHALQIFLLQQHMRFLYARVQPVLPGISPIYIHVWSISCSTKQAAQMVPPERRRKTEGEGEEEEEGGRAG